ncbi:tRNA-specific 2-thiouridylase MnmA [Methylopila jiangsuensis]|uniref:tRNA-specific 2-thiouridylase MnmA n=1 Tax=Methylopila jiangsuensis TaxID=586230 RepID=A0A9W6JHR2_9HYPH|nr:tRNA 2-thiouridine(34) synthase MnmA [Methylopila jiangsuensis]MDR6284044.1 tRNA-specific 2-thiouridylase [Methylopila jiangsuensis]GLK76443.1 tRNA-specific 2-thiouridylase MnmA [Methylopila jiangsuensis]
MTLDLDLPGPPAANRVVVAMSGGVDSSVVAGLLARAGYDVVGVTLQLYDHGAAVARKGACCAGRDIHDARRVAETLSIPHYVLDYEARFRKAVIEPFAASYLAGETPVPCVSCNQTVKFVDLLETAKDLGAAALATGHYVASRALAGGGRGLFRPADDDRDQSYFLYGVTREQLGLLRFPLGDTPKPQVRELARELGLGVADKPDSQDICFVPNGRYADVIEKLKPGAAEPGPIVHVDGRALGTHDGVLRYTVGQRRGLNLSVGEPLFVVRIEADSRTLVVGPREALETRTIRIREVNWLGDGALEDIGPEGLTLRAKVRSTRPSAPARLRPLGNGEAEVELLDGESGVAPGQACALYDEETGRRVLGGGIICAPRRVAATARPMSEAVR